MNASRLLMITACSLAVAGGAGLALAQITAPATPSTDTQSPQNPNQATAQNPEPSTTAPGASDSTATMGTERAARADRN